MGKSDKTPSLTGGERRGTVRLVHRGTVKVWHSSFPEKLLNIRDFSDTGAFLLCDWSDMPPLGSIIEMQLQGLAEAAPRIKAKLVRYAGKGIGVAFCEE
ncbi:MAG: hypothetical protein L0Y38_00105 [Methylococcaceae bacterium]|nr:hypothetical protein [Methylococcaceae bacterium]MCI0732209.1 hypothetical protein [Methylococcaceae bacterium]